MKGALASGGVALVAGAVALNRALVGVFYDDGLYAGLATALAGGLGYVHPHLPGTPAAVHYPPLYPAVLAPLFGLLSVPAAALAAKILNVILAALGAALVAWHAVRSELLAPGAEPPPWLAPLIVCASAVAIPVLATQSVLFAEPLFGVLLAAAVILADRDASPWLVGSAAALAMLTRSIGVAAAAGIVCFMLERRAPARRIAAMLVPVVVTGTAWGMWVLTHKADMDPALALNYGSYDEVLRQVGFAALGVSAPDLPRPLGALTLGWVPWPWLYFLIGGAGLVVGLYGLVLLARRSAAGLTLVFYLAILTIWPYPPDRFLWAVLPWLALAWAEGAFALWRRPKLRVAVALVAVLLGGGFFHYEVRGIAGRWWATQAYAISATFVELLPAVAALPGDAVVATDDEALVWLYTRRRTVPLYIERYRGRQIDWPSAAEHRAYLERMGVTHIVLASTSSPSAAQLRVLLKAYPTWLTAVHRLSGDRWVFEVHQ